jgi:hypothetical protein
MKHIHTNSTQPLLKLHYSYTHENKWVIASEYYDVRNGYTVHVFEIRNVIIDIRNCYN